MPINFTRKQTQAALTLFLLSMLVATIMLSNSTQVKAQTEPNITVVGSTGTTITYTLSQLEALPNITQYGGFYQPNQHTINSGLWTGVSLLTLCNQVGGITSTCNVTVAGQGVNNFTYDMVNSGTNLNAQYITYNNVTGAVQSQTQPVTLILAYQVNGTNLPSSSLPAPRLVHTVQGESASAAPAPAKARPAVNPRANIIVLYIASSSCSARVIP